MNGLLMKFNSAFFSALLALSISQLTMNADVWAQNQEEEEAERWFEVEVILFKQLGDKAELKEQFPDGINASNLPSYKESFDLLSLYLQPNLTSIKQFMPLCGEQDKQHLFLESLQHASMPFLEQAKLIEQVAIFNMPDISEASEENIQHRNEDSDIVAFAFDLQKETLAKPIFSTKDLCIITQKEMESLLDKEQLAHFNIDSFGVDALPGRLNASGTHNSDRPYLIADDSLLLNDISQRLRWSKEFKPMLHFGWRQVGITQKEAIPLKLFAGEHIEYQYQQALTDYKLEIAEAKAIEENLLEQLAPAQDITKMTKAEQKQQALTLLFSRIENMDKNQLDENAVSDIVSRIEKQNFEAILTKHDAKSTSDDQLLDKQLLGMSTPPKKPLQPWLLDGFLKIHLDHYLYITADFNVFNQDQVKPLSEKDKTDEMKLVNFSQNRRVITGEIHYFDHPYIGMIVQIRRFDPTMPAGEQVSQAIR